MSNRLNASNNTKRLLGVAFQGTEFNVNAIDFKFLFRLDPYEERASLSGSDNFIRIMNTFKEQSIGSFEFPDDKFGE